MVKLGKLRINIYHEYRKISPAKARELVRKVYERNGKKIKRTARILHISKNTVKRAIRGPLADKRRVPKNQPRRTREEFEQMIIKEQEATGFGYRQLTGYLKKKYGIEFKEWTIKKVLYRNGKIKGRRQKKNNYKMLYVYDSLQPFQEVQVDTKHLHDETSLPKFVYERLRKKNLPLYQWTFIDVKTRIRFLLYSYNLYSYYGFFFLYFILTWLRAHKVEGRINIRVDNGTEFTGGSKRKLSEWNRFFQEKFNAVLYTIPKGEKQYNAIVENSHRKDDEEFLIPFAQVIQNKQDFILKAQKWVVYWNTKRIHYAKGFKKQGETSKEVLGNEGDNLINTNLVYFPVFLIEDLLNHKNPSLLDLIPSNSFLAVNLDANTHSSFSCKGVNISVPSASFILFSICS